MFLLVQTLLTFWAEWSLRIQLFLVALKIKLQAVIKSAAGPAPSRESVRAGDLIMARKSTQSVEAALPGDF